MKKLLSTLIAVCYTLLISTSTVYAFTPADLAPLEETQNRVHDSAVYAISEFSSFDYVSNVLSKYAQREFETTEKKPTWAIRSLNNHQDLQFHIFYDKKPSEKYEKLINCIDESCDFVQIGGLLDTSVLKDTKEAFESDPVEAALNAIIPIDASANKEKVYTELRSHNIPIYWEITENSSDVFTLEVAIGKYVIQPGDTLSKIALNYQTTVEKLLEDNVNITNPDLIYAGDYIVIK